MKKAISIILLCTAILCLCIGCSNGDNEKTTSFDIELFATLVSCKVGEMTDEKLLSYVDVVNEDGSKVKPTLYKGNTNFNAVGEYEVLFSYKQETKAIKLRIYGMPKLYFNGEEFTDDTVTMNYGDAKSSYDFVKGIVVKDSFDQQLDVAKSQDSDVFDYTKQSFIVTYTATDVVGNKLNKTITYNLSTEFNPTIASKTLNLQDDEDLELELDLKGETDFLLYNQAEIIPEQLYALNGDKLVIKKELVSTLAIGENELRVETIKGNGVFSLNVLDNGKPFFTVESESPILLSEAKTISVELPKIVIPNHTYTWQYTLTDRNDVNNICSVENINNSLVLLNNDGSSITSGRYYLDIKATNDKGSLTKRMDVRVFSEKYWTGSIGSLVEFGVYDDENVIKALSTSSNSKESVLLMPKTKIEGYTKISFDVLVKSYFYSGENYKNTTSPLLIFWQGENNDDDYLDITKRLTPRATAGYNGQERIIDLSTNEEISWDFGWETDKWYRITLALNDIEGDLYQKALNGDHGSYEILYKNFSYEEESDLIWEVGVNTVITNAPYENENVTSVKTLAEYKKYGGYITIPSIKLDGIAKVSFDMMIVSMKDLEGKDITTPKMIFYQDTAGTGTDYGEYWTVDYRLTPKGDKPSYSNTGYQTITKISDGTAINWDDSFETNTWYRVVLTLKSEEQLSQVVNNGNGCSYEILYKNFEFKEPADLVWTAGVNTTVDGVEYEQTEITRVTTTETYKTKGGYIAIPLERLNDVTTVSFDMMIVSMKDADGKDISTPKMIFYQDTAGTGTDYGEYWTVAYRLTEKGDNPNYTNTGYQTITKITNSATLNWDSTFETNIWYRVVLTLKSGEQLSQVVNNGNGCSYEILYRNFVFE